MLAFMVCPRLAKVSQCDGDAENMQCSVMPQYPQPYTQ